MPSKQEFHYEIGLIHSLHLEQNLQDQLKKIDTSKNNPQLNQQGSQDIVSGITPNSSPNFTPTPTNDSPVTDLNQTQTLPESSEQLGTDQK